jgi:hypothetical protein
MGKFGANVGGNSDFLKIETGRPVVVAFVGEVIEYYQKWVEEGGNKKTVVTTSQDADGKFRFDAVVVEKNTMTAKVMSGGPMIYGEIQKYETAGYDLSKSWFQITKTGSGLGTEYSVIPIPQFAFTPLEVEKVSMMALPSITKRTGAAPTTNQNTPNTDVTSPAWN